MEDTGGQAGISASLLAEVSNGLPRESFHSLTLTGKRTSQGSHCRSGFFLIQPPWGAVAPPQGGSGSGHPRGAVAQGQMYSTCIEEPVRGVWI